MKVVQVYEQTQNCCGTLPKPKNSLLVPQKMKMIQKIGQNQMSEFKETQKMKVVKLHEQTPKQLSKLTPTTKPAHQDTKNTKMTPKLSQILISQFRESSKIKIVQLHEQTSKQFLKPTLNPKIAHQGPKKSRTNSKFSQNQTSEWKETKKIKVVALYEQTQKYFEPDPKPQISLCLCSKKPKRNYP